MDLTHTFTVPASLEETWAAFNDLESVAACFPGASLTSVDGDEFKGSCKVKLGPIALVYSGTGKFVERDEAAHRFVIEARGKDKRGNGTAGATVTAVLTAVGDDATEAEVVTDLTITGKPAQFGRGVIQDVSDKLLQQFVDCLESKVGAAAGAATEAAAGAGAGAAGSPPGRHAAPSRPEEAPTPPRGGGAATSPVETPPVPQVPPAQRTSVEDLPMPAPIREWQPPAERGADRDSALDLGATVLPVLLRAYWKPLVGGSLGLLLVGWLLRRRGR